MISLLLSIYIFHLNQLFKAESMCSQNITEVDMSRENRSDREIITAVFLLISENLMSSKSGYSYVRYHISHANFNINYTNSQSIGPP